MKGGEVNVSTWWSRLGQFGVFITRRRKMDMCSGTLQAFIKDSRTRAIAGRLQSGSMKVRTWTSRRCERNGSPVQASVALAPGFTQTVFTPHLSTSAFYYATLEATDLHVFIEQLTESKQQSQIVPFLNSYHTRLVSIESWRRMGLSS